MPQSTKIATCSYCGTRAALVLDQGRHELVCGTCGAPLHDMKPMPLVRGTASKPARAKPAPGTRKKVSVDWAAERRHALGQGTARPAPRHPSRPGKRRKSLGARVLSEIWDVVEDIFD
ncbi:hypothetical protein M8756_03710 [Lutimaribacter sp. EGI FJ00015]|uniref:Uncharacterized protein n=1 Tax=Lutimaribacter degradans TaxID=2945989 RepID=A0ACC5ZTB8_9RHOB|nr:hypothetical protein [Lutimaribacter sp. EGI FJ00013]MCM2560654.1 hypothetical protein [Lutimaribacter sp. EGI FJ00013]MCO0612403.1 hypothetical protein [Lutimaribacter sp. EGI FJ00015]MCO0634478.1 hypothetical protein [Lutimaribacter sp. EGI FJ00014]